MTASCLQDLQLRNDLEVTVIQFRICFFSSMELNCRLSALLCSSSRKVDLNCPTLSLVLFLPSLSARLPMAFHWKAIQNSNRLKLFIMKNEIRCLACRRPGCSKLDKSHQNAVWHLAHEVHGSCPNTLFVELHLV